MHIPLYLIDWIWSITKLQRGGLSSWSGILFVSGGSGGGGAVEKSSTVPVIKH